MSCLSVQHLAQEHREVEEVLDAFDAFVNQSESEAGPDRRELWQLIDALTESLLLRHEEKEETVLLPELVRHGLSWSDGTLNHVRKDHRHGRYLMRTLRQAAHQLADWSGDDRRHFVSIGREWSQFVRRHMRSEETLLFPYLDRQLSPEQDAELLAQFENIDQDFEQMPDAAGLAEGKDAFVQRFRSSSEGA